MHGNTKNLVGKQFGRLLVLTKAVSKGGHSRWKCECDCGTIKIIYGSHLRRGSTTSCGCYQKEQISKARRIKKGKASFNALFRQYKTSAKKRGYKWDLSKDEFKILTKQQCYYCGSEPTQLKTHNHYYGDYTYSGIDRVDNSIGYISNNVVPCCKHCNTAKKEMSKDEFLNWLERAYNWSFSSGN